MDAARFAFGVVDSWLVASVLLLLVAGMARAYREREPARVFFARIQTPFTLASYLVTTLVLFGAPLRSQAAPTPQPVPHSAMVPVRVAARVASSRPVSVREACT